MSIDDVLCSLITGSEVGVVVGEEFQVGVQLMYELFGQGLEGVYSVLSDCNFKGVREDQDGMIRWGGGGQRWSEWLDWCHRFPVPRPGCVHGW